MHLRSAEIRGVPRRDAEMRVTSALAFTAHFFLRKRLKDDRGRLALALIGP